jgi:NAD(P)-dependent dehydrogenase (short-subunit alcohol dehydrogenase family)
MEIAGQTALVTGSASGIGRATALLLAEKGASLFLVDLDSTGLDETKRLVEQAGGQAKSATIDVSDKQMLESAFVEAKEWKGAPRIVINNAGIATGRPGFPHVPPEQWQKVVDVDLSAVMYGVQLAVEGMKETGGAIVNTASMAGLYAWAGEPIYSASKAGVVFLTRALAPLNEQYGIRVNCVCPGLVDTPLVRRGIEASEDEEVKKAFETIPMIDPRQVAEGMVSLIEDDTMVGQALMILLEGNVIAEAQDLASVAPSEQGNRAQPLSRTP